MAHTLTRQQLYDRVWTTPIYTIAGELGLSGRGLGKLCTRHDIPVPPRGWWAKKAHGKRVKQPPLPPVERDYKIHFGGAGQTATAAEQASTDVHPLVAFEQQAANRIDVPPDLPTTHALVLKAERSLRRSKREPNGLIAAPPGALNIHTSRALHERALRIMQALMTAFETRGFPVAITNEGARVTILDESLGLGIEEGTKTVEHRISYTEQRLIDRGLGYQVPKSDHAPSGQLSLVITNVRHVRQRWTEGRKPLEEMLNRFLVGLVRAALALKQQRADAERREKERQEEERKREEEARKAAEQALLIREEDARVQRIERLASLCERNKRIRATVAQAKAALGTVNADSETGRWLEWAERYAERSDPLHRLRSRTSRMLTLYYYEWDKDRVSESGFQEPSEVARFGQEAPKSGVKLTTRPPSRRAYESALKIELPEDLVLSYEWPQESDFYYRVFRVPASLLNRTLGFGRSPDGDDAAP